MSNSQVIELNAGNILCKLIDVWALRQPKEHSDLIYKITSDNYGNYDNILQKLKAISLNLANDLHQLNKIHGVGNE